MKLANYLGTLLLLLVGALIVGVFIYFVDMF